MKPKYIFSAVFFICVLLVTGLPQLARPSAAAAVAVSQPAAAVQAAPLQGNGQNQAAVAQPVVQPTVSPTLAPAPTENIAAPAVESAAPAPVRSGLVESLPSPADLAASAGQGLLSIPETTGQPDLDSFIASVRDGVATRLTGVYVAGVFSLPVVQQPDGEVNYVDINENTVTEYSRSTPYDVIGLLAHNTLRSGQSFFKLKPGQDVVLVYGNGRQVRYRIDRVENYQALSYTDPFSNFIDLNGPGGQLILNEDLFRKIYTNSGQLVFQTCFEANGDPSWGRMFVIANPL